MLQKLFEVFTVILVFCLELFYLYLLVMSYKFANKKYPSFKSKLFGKISYWNFPIFKYLKALITKGDFEGYGKVSFKDFICMVPFLVVRVVLIIWTIALGILAVGAAIDSGEPLPIGYINRAFEEGAADRANGLRPTSYDPNYMDGYNSNNN